MYNLETLTVLKMNNRVININLESLTHKESLLSPEVGGNCINWVLGHLLISRDDINKILGIDKVSDEKLLERYKSGTKPLTKDNAIDINEILQRFNDSQAVIEEKVESTDFSDRKKDLETLAFLAFHEAYHAGQTGLLRRLSGKSGAIK